MSARGWDVSVLGIENAVDTLQAIQFQFDGDTTYVVGPTVEYAIYVDKGTSKMEARPFVEPAARRVQGNIESSIAPFLEGGRVSEDALVKATAVAVQREMQRIITEKGAVDTGTLRASVSVEEV